MQCLQRRYRTIQQFHQHLKAEQLDRRTLQIIVLQLRNDFAILRYLIFSSVRTTPISNTSVKNSTISPSTNLKPNPNPNPNHKPPSNTFPLPCAKEPSVRRSTPQGAAGPPRAKANNSGNAEFQFSPNTQEAPPLTAQNLISGISKPEKLFADEIAHLSPWGFFLGTFSYMAKSASLKQVTQMLPFRRFPQ